MKLSRHQHAKPNITDKILTLILENLLYKKNS